ncbi:unnamed protein product [Rhizophagus irregularis]|nr:unnamed protein product [Rhizophagus irregularis]
MSNLYSQLPRYIQNSQVAKNERPPPVSETTRKFECHKYELFVPLHELWLQYIEELYGKSSPNIFGQKLLKADFHGAILTVSKSKCASYIGVTGIAIQETENMFKLITEIIYEMYSKRA